MFRRKIYGIVIPGLTRNPVFIPVSHTHETRYPAFSLTFLKVLGSRFHACVPCLRRSGSAQAGETPHSGVQTRERQKSGSGIKRLGFSPRVRTSVCALSPRLASSRTIPPGSSGCLGGGPPRSRRCSPPCPPQSILGIGSIRTLPRRFLWP